MNVSDNILDLSGCDLAGYLWIIVNKILHNSRSDSVAVLNFDMSWGPLKDLEMSKLTDSDSLPKYEQFGKSDSGSSLQVPSTRRSGRRRRKSSVVKDFGQMSLEWDTLTATIEITTRVERWRSPLCCLKSSVKERKTILDKVSGTAKPGELSILMGASGAGKTTLLNCLYGYSKNATLKCTGDIRVQGAPAKYCMGKISAYVEQEPRLLSCLTVWEHIWFHTALRATDCFGPDDIKSKVNSVLRKVGLLHTQGTVIGVSGNGISGGEKKRLSLATELISDPPILFADESTSGLDSTTALSIIKLLKSLAKDGRTIILSIHQPSSAIFMMCDRLTLLSGGQTAFHGSMSEIAEFLEQMGSPCPMHFNLADHLMDLSTGEGAYGMIKFYSSSVSKGYQAEGKVCKASSVSSLLDALAMSGTVGSRQVSFLAQLKAVMWRSGVVNARHLTLGKMRMFQTIFVAGLLSIIFFQIPDNPETSVSKIGVICLAILNHTCIVGFAVMRAFIADKGIYIQEKQLNMYTATVLFISQNLTDLPFTLLHGWIYSTIIYWAVGFQSSFTKYLTTTAAITLSDVCSVGYGMSIAALARDFTRAQAINLGIFSLMALFIGNFLNPQTIPAYLQAGRYFCWMAPAVEIAAVTEFKDSFFNSTNNATFHGFDSGLIVLEFYGFDASNYLQRDLIWLFVLMLFYRLTAYLVLLLKSRKSGANKIDIQKS